jgi:hypothetical protein
MSSATQLGFTSQKPSSSPISPDWPRGGAQGGFNQGITGNIGPGAMIYLTNDKPTANASLTWVHGNHT